MVRSAVSTLAPVTSSRLMMPALLISTLRVGKRSITSVAKRWMSVGPVISRVKASMPGLARRVSSSFSWVRPAITTWLPSWWKASARPRPIPLPPPVIRRVLSVTCMIQLHMVEED